MSICTAFGQKHLFKHFTVDEGSPSSEVYNIYQTQTGYIVLTTDRGVSYFDGHGFYNYSLYEGLPDNTIFLMYESEKDEKLWFSTLSGKIFNYNEKGIEVLPEFVELTKASSLSKFIRSFYIDDQDVIWMAIDGSSTGFWQLINKDSLLTQALTDTGSYIQAKFIGRDRYALTNHTQGKEWRIKLRDQTVVDLSEIMEQNEKGEFFLEMLEDDSFIYLHSLYSILRVSKKDHSYDQYRPEKGVIDGIYFDRQNNLWAGVIDGGALKFENKDLSKPPKHLLNEESVTSILEDNQSGYWFTTLDNGVFYMPWEESYSYGEKEQLCSVIALQEGKLWAGCAFGEVVAYEEGTMVKKYDLSLSKGHHEIQSIACLADRVYVVGSNRLYEIINDQVKLASYGGISRKLIQDEEELWVIGNGFCIIKNNNVAFDSRSINYQNWVTGLAKKNDSTYLLGTFYGVWEFDGEKIYPNNYGNEILNKRISDIKVMENYTLFSTPGNGVLIQTVDSTIHLKEEIGGLLSNICNSIYVEDDSTFWVATNKGLNKVLWSNGGDRKQLRISGITKEDGLRSSEINQVLVDDSFVYIATHKGLHKITKAFFEEKKYDVPVYINKIKIGGKMIRFNKEINLMHDAGDIQLNYAALFLKNKENVTYRYRLNKEDSWVYTKNRSVQFSNLSANTYTFLLEASTDGRSWTRAVKTIIFKVSPPFWKTNWFLLLAMLVSGSIVSLIFFWRLNYIKKETDLKKKALVSEYMALKAQLNPHFMFNSLNSINSFILTNDRFQASKYLTKFSKLMRLTLDNSMEQAIGLDKEIDALKLYLEIETFRAEGKFNFEISWEDDMIPEKYYVSPMNIQPFVENAILHGVLPLTNRKGNIKVSFKTHSDTCVLCVVADNGIGRKKSEHGNKEVLKAHKPKGVSLINKGLQVLGDLKGQSFGVSISDETIGTKVEIIIPAKIVRDDQNNFD